MTFEDELQKELNEFAPITGAIADEALREEIVALLAAEILARLALGEIRLEPYEQPDFEHPELDMWEKLAQPVRSALVALLELKSTLLTFAPRPNEEPDTADFDLAFDLVDQAPPVERLRDTLGEQVDAWIEATLESAERTNDAKPNKAPAELRSEVQTAIGPLADIIVSEISRFGNRLRNPNVVGDRWNLLADLQEFKGKFTKLLGAMRFGLLSPFTSLSESELLKVYKTELDTALTLRRGVVLLTRDVNSLFRAYHVANVDEQRFILEELLVRLLRFSRSEAFMFLRAPDKRNVIEFRKNLALNVGMSRDRPRQVAELLDGFIKFLEVMSAINRREALVRHDTGLIGDLRSKLLVVEEVLELDLVSAKQLLDDLRQQALSLFGRETMLDDWLNAHAEVDDRSDLRAQIAWLKRALQRIKM